jgi:hypothetical protein
VGSPFPILPGASSLFLFRVRKIVKATIAGRSAQDHNPIRETFPELHNSFQRPVNKDKDQLILSALGIKLSPEPSDSSHSFLASVDRRKAFWVKAGSQSKGMARLYPFSIGVSQAKSTKR